MMIAKVNEYKHKLYVAMCATEKIQDFFFLNHSISIGSKTTNLDS